MRRATALAVIISAAGLVALVAGELALHALVVKPAATEAFFESVEVLADQSDQSDTSETFPIADLGNALLPICMALCFQSISDYDRADVVLALNPTGVHNPYVRLLKQCDVTDCEAFEGTFFREARNDELALLKTASQEQKCVNSSLFMYAISSCRRVKYLAGHIVQIDHNLLLGVPMSSFWKSSQFERVAGVHIDRVSGAIQQEVL